MSLFRWFRRYRNKAATVFVVMSVPAICGCTEDKQRTMLDHLSKAEIEKSVGSNAVCKAFTLVEVERISGFAITAIETSSADALFCRYTLSNGSSFSISAQSWPKIVDIPLDCYDEQNTSDGHRKYQPFCMAVVGPKRIDITSPGEKKLPKETMRLLMQVAMQRLGQ